jgi:hypothetical protein
MGSICTAIPRVAGIEASERGINTLAIVTLELVWTTNWRLHTYISIKRSFVNKTGY